MLTDTPGYQRKLMKTHMIAQTGQYHGCPTCGKITWHDRKKQDGVVVLKCTECGRKEG